MRAHTCEIEFSEARIYSELFETERKDAREECTTAQQNVLRRSREKVSSVYFRAFP